MDEEQTNIYAEPITSLYYARVKLPDNIIQSINEDIESILKNKSDLVKCNSVLAGNIEEEYGFFTKSSSLVKDFSTKVAEGYFQIIEDENLNPIKRFTHDNNFFEKKVNYEVESLWINLQKKYEFNPRHSHLGDYSFVIWMRIPYDLSEELNCNNCKNANEALNSLFEFNFLSPNGKIESLPLFIDKTWEGTMVMFPSWLDHTVYPFYTSDDYRISISGNIVVKMETT